METDSNARNTRERRLSALVGGLILLAIAALQFQLYLAGERRDDILLERCLARNGDTKAILQFVTGFPDLPAEAVGKLQGELEPQDCTVHQ